MGVKGMLWPDVREVVAAMLSVAWTVLVGLKLEGTLSYSWWTVFAPAFVGIGLVLYLDLILGVRAASALQQKEGLRHFGWSLVFWVPTLAFVVLTAQKLNGDSDVSWTVVFSPIWVGTPLFALVSTLAVLNVS